VHIRSLQIHLHFHLCPRTIVAAAGAAAGSVRYLKRDSGMHSRIVDDTTPHALDVCTARRYSHVLYHVNADLSHLQLVPVPQNSSAARPPPTTTATSSSFSSFSTSPCILICVQILKRDVTEA
jgi:hypothetical protein